MLTDIFIFVECALTCHAHCTHLVPDFCGMSIEVANQILDAQAHAKHHNKSTSVSSGLSGRTLRPGGPPQPPQDHPQKASDSPYGALNRLPSAEAVSAATNSYMTSQSPAAVSQAARQPMPPKSPSVASDAKAAADAAARLRSTPQTPGMYITVHLETNSKSSANECIISRSKPTP